MNRLEKILGGISGLVPLATSLFYRNSAPHTPAERILGTGEPLINNPSLTPYVGNFPESFMLPLISGLIGDALFTISNRTSNSFLQFVGRYFPELASTALCTYFTLGETVFPQILPGVSDIKDVPIVFVNALAGYTFAKIGRNNGINSKLFSLLAESSPSNKALSE